MDPLKKSLLILCVAIAGWGCEGSDSVVRASGKVEVYATYPKSEPGNMVVGVLSPGETSQVLATRHSKEFMFYRIKLANGREGYVMFGDDFKVEKP